MSCCREEIMARVKLPFVNGFVDRHGRVRYYFRKPCASKIASVQPCDEPASNLSARRWSALSRDFRALIAIARR